MSTVVGTCTDCIVSLPPISKQSMSLVVRASLGQNLIRQQVGDFQGFYPSDNIANQQVTLAPGTSFGPTVGISSLLVATDKPLQVTVTKNNVALTFTVNALLILDDSYDGFQVTNLSTTDTANVNIVFAA